MGCLASYTHAQTHTHRRYVDRRYEYTVWTLELHYVTIYLTLITGDLCRRLGLLPADEQHLTSTRAQFVSFLNPSLQNITFG